MSVIPSHGESLLEGIESSARDIAAAANDRPDLATRVAADIFARASERCGYDSEMCEIAARDAIRCGRIFAEAVIKERS